MSNNLYVNAIQSAAVEHTSKGFVFKTPVTFCWSQLPLSKTVGRPVRKVVEETFAPAEICAHGQPRDRLPRARDL